MQSCGLVEDCEAGRNPLTILTEVSGCQGKPDRSVGTVLLRTAKQDEIPTLESGQSGSFSVSEDTDHPLQQSEDHPFSPSPHLSSSSSPLPPIAPPLLSPDRTSWLFGIQLPCRACLRGHNRFGRITEETTVMGITVPYPARQHREAETCTIGTNELIGTDREK
jgi:hypothetical protein